MTITAFGATNPYLERTMLPRSHRSALITISNPAFAIEPMEIRQLLSASFGFAADIAPGANSSLAVAADGTGNSYVVSATSGGEFVTKYSSNGALVWQTKVAPLNETAALAVNASGQVAETTGSGNGSNTETLVELNADGSIAWTRSFAPAPIPADGAPGDVNLNAVAIDSQGNVYVTGVFAGRVDFGTSRKHPAILTAPSGTFTYHKRFGTVTERALDTFVTKYNVNSQLVWAKDLGGQGPHAGYNNVEGTSIQVGADNQIYVAGTFTGTANFAAGAHKHDLTATTTGNATDLYLAVLDSGSGTGVRAAATPLGRGSGTESVGVDAAGDAFVTVNGDESEIWKVTAAGQSQPIVSIRLPGSSSSVGASAVTPAGNIYSTGYFSGSGNFNPPGSPAVLNAANGAFFLEERDSSGNFVSVVQFGAGVVPPMVAGAGSPESLAADAAGNLFINGFFDATGNFDPEGGTSTLTGSGSFLVGLSVGS
jgi:hypothetical protein